MSSWYRTAPIFQMSKQELNPPERCRLEHASAAFLQLPH